MGLSLGQTESPESDDHRLVDKRMGDVSSNNNEQYISDEELVYPSDGKDDLPRVWTRVDRDDLTKLGEMITKFIGVPQFVSEPHVFLKMVAAPLLDKRGPRFGATQVVSQVMSQVMFRHQWVVSGTFQTSFNTFP